MVLHEHQVLPPHYHIDWSVTNDDKTHSIGRDNDTNLKVNKKPSKNKNSGTPRRGAEHFDPFFVFTGLIVKLLEYSEHVLLAGLCFRIFIVVEVFSQEGKTLEECIVFIFV